MALDPGQLGACEELAVVPGSEFETVYPFLRGAARERLLAVEALFRSLREIPHSVSDPSVGVAKLAWWQRELAGAADNGSQHPVVQALVATGAVELAGGDDFNHYLHALLTSLQDEPFADVEALRRYLDDTAGKEARMLAAGDSPGEAPVSAAGAAARLLELIRTLAQPGVEPRWLPLELRARHDYRFDQDNPSERLAELTQDLSGLALGWRRGAPLAPGSGMTAGAGFVLVRDALVGRRLAALRRRPATALATVRGPSVGEAFTAWRAARRVTRQIGGEW